MYRSWSFSPGWSRFFDLPRGSAFASAALRRRSLGPASEEWRLVVLAAHLPEAA